MDGAMATAVETASSAAARTLELKRGESVPKSLAALQNVAKAFDGVFASTMLSTLLAPAIGAGLGGSGPGASVVQGMIEQNLADSIAKGGGFGVGRMIVHALRSRIAAQSKPVAAPTREGDDGFRPIVGKGTEAAGNGFTRVEEGGR